MTDELALQRMQRLADEAERYEANLLNIAAHMKLYREANGFDPITTDLLAVWVHANLDGPVDPYVILSREEIVQVWEDAEDPARQSY
jgi:hypothetical protein